MQQTQTNVVIGAKIAESSHENYRIIRSQLNNQQAVTRIVRFVKNRYIRLPYIEGVTATPKKIDFLISISSSTKWISNEQFESCKGVVPTTDDKQQSIERCKNVRLHSRCQSVLEDPDCPCYFFFQLDFAISRVRAITSKRKFDIVCVPVGRCGATEAHSTF